MRLLAIIFISTIAQGQVKYFPALVRTSGTVYYVSADGDDENSGLAGQPWQTLDNVNSTTFEPNDVIAFKGGDSFTGKITKTESGLRHLPITITSYGTGKAKIISGDSSGIQLKNNQWFTVNNIEVQGSGINTANGTYTNRGAGLVATSTATSGARLKGIRFVNNKVHGTRVGILIEANASTHPQTSWRGYDSAYIYGNEVYNCSHTGILTYGQSEIIDYDHGGYSYGFTSDIHTNIFIKRNYVHDMYGFVSSDYSLAGAGTGIRTLNTDGGLIDYNRVYNVGHTGSQYGTPAGFEAECSRNITWRANESSHVTFRADQIGSEPLVEFDGAGFDVFDGHTQNMIVESNLSYLNDGYGIGGGNGGFGSPNTGHIARFNILYNNDQSGELGEIQFWAEMTGCKIYNNTIYNITSGGAIFNFSSAFDANPNVTGTVIANNIIVSPNRAIVHSPSTTTVLANNLYWRGLVGSLGITINSVTYNTLAALHTANYEIVSGVNYGVNDDPDLFDPEQTILGLYLPTNNVSTLDDYDLLETSPALSAGVHFSSLTGSVTGLKDFHEVIISTINNIGAVQLEP